MKEPLQHRLSEIGESFDYLRSDVRNLSRYTAKLEKLVESYRTFASNATLTTQVDREVRRQLLTRTQRIIGPPEDAPCQDCQEVENTTPGNEAQVGPRVQMGKCKH
jgi:hypothetical protein